MYHVIKLFFDLDDHGTKIAKVFFLCQCIARRGLKDRVASNIDTHPKACWAAREVCVFQRRIRAVVLSYRGNDGLSIGIECFSSLSSLRKAQV